MQQMFPSTEQDRRNGEVELVDEGFAQVLPNRSYASTQSDVAAARRIPCLLQRRMNTLGDERQLRAARHPERRSRVMRQHEDRGVIRRFVAPPAFPAFVGPRPPNGTEHVTPENPRADSGEAFRGNIVVRAGLAILIAVHTLPGLRMEEPV